MRFIWAVAIVLAADLQLVRAEVRGANAGTGDAKPHVGLIDGHELRSLLQQKGATAESTALHASLKGFDVLVLTVFSPHARSGQARAFQTQSGRNPTTRSATSGWCDSRRPRARTSGHFSRHGAFPPATVPGPPSKTSPTGCRPVSSPSSAISRKEA